MDGTAFHNAAYGTYRAYSGGEAVTQADNRSLTRSLEAGVGTDPAQSATTHQSHMLRRSGPSKGERPERGPNIDQSETTTD